MMNPIQTAAGGLRNKRRSWLLATSLAAILPTGALAQEAAVSADADIVVTGSRVAVSGYSAPTPTAVIGGDLIQKQGAASVAEVLQMEPAFKATRSAGGNANNFANPGQATADLRGLGGQRTLVLVNGARVVPQAPSNNANVPVTTDLNMIPTNMIDRVEVVTGGASAQYGSDAVAGVVNILLKRQYEGFEVNASAGISGQGDNEKYRLGFLGGREFADGKGHLIFSAEQSDSEAIKDLYERDWGRDEYMIVTNSAFATNGLPANIVATGVHNNNSEGGKILAGANAAGTAVSSFSLRGFTFNADGTTRPYDAGLLNNGTYQIGGEGRSRNNGSSLIPGVERLTTFARAQYEFSPAATVYIEGGYARTVSDFVGGLPNIASFTVRNDNAFLPQAVKNTMAAQGVTSFTMSKGFYDMGNIQFTTTNETPHATVGIEGDLGGSWSYDAHYSYGENNFTSEFDNNFMPTRYAFAADSILVNGQIVCRATLPAGAANSGTYTAAQRAAATGCVPLNIFGPGPNTTTGLAQNWVNVSGKSEVPYTQSSAGVNLRGDIFNTWAGPVAVAIGGEWRRETQKLTADPLSAAGLFLIGNATPFSGKFDVKEGYIEALVPLAKDLAWAHSLDLNGAVRYADYSTAGGQTTWKVGSVWEPIEGYRLRVTRSRDIRAPAIYELFSPGSTTATAINVNGIAPIVPQNRSIGNLNLRPEVADTLTVGFVVQPNWLSGLRASIDYFDIDITDAIDSLRPDQIGNGCSAGDQFYCSFITFGPGRVPTAVNAGVQNIAAFQTEGLDAAVSYRKDLAGTNALTTRLSATYALHSYINGVDRAGENGQGNLGAVPRLRANLIETYSNDKVSLSAQVVYISKGNNDNTFNTIPALTINKNRIGPQAYLNLFGTYQLSKTVEISASVDNVLDTDPPPSPYAAQGQAVSGILYDKVGRTFEVGARFKF
jgi:outer membrane receptor protein involved in Fe transport